MKRIRKIKKTLKSRSTIEVSGVHLKRVFGFHQIPQLDPFLLLDDFHSNNPEDYIRGFPWHPHREIETITYIIEGAGYFDESRNSFDYDVEVDSYFDFKPECLIDTGNLIIFRDGDTDIIN